MTCLSDGRQVRPVSQRTLDLQRRAVHGEGLRRALRLLVNLRAHLRDHGRPRFPIDVVDLSRTGFRAQTNCLLRPESTVWLTLPGFAARRASVVWRKGLEYGCAFTEPLHPAVLHHIVSRAEH